MQGPVSAHLQAAASTMSFSVGFFHPLLSTMIAEPFKPGQCSAWLSQKDMASFVKQAVVFLFVELRFSFGKMKVYSSFLVLDLVNCVS